MPQRPLKPCLDEEHTYRVIAITEQDGYSCHTTGGSGNWAINGEHTTGRQTWLVCRLFLIPVPKTFYKLQQKQ